MEPQDTFGIYPTEERGAQFDIDIKGKSQSRVTQVSHCIGWVEIVPSAQFGNQELIDLARKGLTQVLAILI